MANLVKYVNEANNFANTAFAKENLKFDKEEVKKLKELQKKMQEHLPSISARFLGFILVLFCFLLLLKILAIF